MNNKPRRGRHGQTNQKAPPPEFDNKLLGVRRVTRVVAGGRRFSFSVAVVLGNRRGRVGVGVGKGGDISSAIDKATKDGKKHLLTVPLTANQSLPHEVMAKFGGSRVALRPAPGRGIVAGSAVRTVIELLGARDVSAKIISKSKNKLNNARAVMAALAQLSASPAKSAK